MPLPRATYLVLVARAVPGLYTAEQIEWELPLARANAIIHAGRIVDGEAMVWPDPMLSERGRWWHSVRQWFRQRRAKSAATDRLTN
jgi:hypothetical protein